MGGYTDIPEQVRAAGPGWRRELPLGLVSVTGADAVGFLQRLCSQDVQALQPGACAATAFLNPKGKLIVAGLALRTEDGVLLEVENTMSATLAGLLEQYHFAEKLTITAAEGRECVGLMGGAEVFGLAGVSPGTCTSGPSGVACAVERHGMCWVHWHGEPGAAPPWGEVGQAWSDAQTEVFRICAGQLRMGVDADADTLALEAGLDDHVSLNKGCYTGQEIVARIHTYGHVNRKLCLLAVESDEAPAPDSELCDDTGTAVGRTTSVAELVPGVQVALSYVGIKSASRGTSLHIRTGSSATVVGFLDPSA